jgi:hypothetical protein
MIDSSAMAVRSNKETPQAVLCYLEESKSYFMMV